MSRFRCRECDNGLVCINGIWEICLECAGDIINPQDEARHDQIQARADELNELS